MTRLNTIGDSRGVCRGEKGEGGVVREAGRCVNGFFGGGSEAL